MRELAVIEAIKEKILPKMPPDIKDIVEMEIEEVAQEYVLASEIESCRVCPLIDTCTNKVMGAGSKTASVMMIGAAPGREEDEQGMPFVGKGGELLMKAIESVGWKRDDLYLTNLVKCHPEGNRNPTAAEIASCYQHLKKEIQMVKPKVLIAVGSTAASILIHPDFRITQEQGHWFEITDLTRAIAIYDPSYLLRLGEGTDRQNQAKWDVFHALKKVDSYKATGFLDTMQSALHEVEVLMQPK